MPQRLTPDLRRVRERETIVALIVLTVLALLVPLARNVAVPTRTVVANGADAAALKASIAPDFTLTTLDGKDVSLSDFKGKIVVINVWATWCPPCVREIPRLVRLSEQYGDQGVVILGINTTWQDDEAKVAQFAREKGISYPVLLDPTNITGPLYRVQLMPSTFVLDHTGRISHTKVGEVDEATLEGYIQTLLAARQEAAQ
jgi:cytochrome c biogenesis protein CcmG, thiol:disulfide interchange protein DsbE